MFGSDTLSEEQLTQSLTYAGFILVSYELVKSLIVEPIKAFYYNTTFGEGLPFKTYEFDVMSRHKNEFEACLMYLRDFMEALGSEDVITIQALRKHRNDLAHNLPDLMNINPNDNLYLLEKVDKALFKLSNYRTKMEIGADPEFKNKGIDWETVYGNEYALYKAIVEKVKVLGLNYEKYV